MPELKAFLDQPVWGSLILTWQLGLSVLILLSLRFLPALGRKLGLLAYSLFFIFVLSSLSYMLLFFAALVLLYYFLFLIQDSPRKQWIAYGLVPLMIAFFFFCKDWRGLESPWTGSFIHNFGISYSLFRLIALVMDVGWGKIRLSANPLDFLSYAFFYPAFFMGPIERFQDFFANNLAKPPPLHWKSEGLQVLRILGAFGKAWIISRYLQFDWEHYFNYPQDLSYGQLWWGMYVRAFSFYLRVSSYNDLTIACCALAGYKIHENYDFSYFRRNLAEFWRTWHMTLMNILRNYIYIPLGGNRRHVYFNYLVIFMFVAMWHVSSKAFVVWGLWHAIGMCLLRLWRNFWKRVETSDENGVFKRLQGLSRQFPRASYALSMLFTFHFVALGWLPFWGGHPQGLSMILRILSGDRITLFLWEP